MRYASVVAPISKDPVHIAFDFKKEQVIDNEENLPAPIMLELNITPQISGIEEITVKAQSQIDDERNLTFVGKVRHRFTNLGMDPVNLTLNALAHEYGIYNVNQMNLDV